MTKKKINILDNEFVPQHTILTEEESNELLQKYNVTYDKLPLILESDPVVKIIGAKPGNIIKIVRGYSPAGKSVFYRYVIGEDVKETLEEEVLDEIVEDDSGEE
ncbi:MAG TPA: DNA-directed RNA polymerase subunit H [Methanofastidiosum sp.]|jgi:DNA-directed RNA polymerase subunit H|nr:DNA-directed RNA polymerase subunit H [Methanofastidiosum sp.]HNZ87600.1 DNA-directed RNA polymerase subunit H [Methanofastidiosum sp.]HOC78468.1 DNA-directed RNA polymerase subunit H [Methanofastidiosum sp.]HOG74000.1 DNA-directed RNA polymerase subunit H [Methanofastidiosum sp.]HPA49644.1 DNA-directed RNA polymerase subunit H [Methanofastidiosum sp.]